MADEKGLKLRPPIIHPDGPEHRRLISGSVQGLLEREISQETLANRPAAGTAGKLFVSTDEPALYRDNGTTWETVERPLAAARVRKTADQTISDVTWTTVTWDVEDYDTDTMHDNATNNSRITVPRAGIYILNTMVAWAVNSTGGRLAGFTINGGRRFSRTGSGAVSVSSGEVIATAIVELAANDYVEVVVFQDSGGNLNVDFENANEFQTSFAVQQLRGAT